MNIQLGNLSLEDIVSESKLEQIETYLKKNGYQRENKCDSIGSKEGNYHIFDIPRQMVICGKNKMEDFINFLQKENLVQDGFKERIGLTYTDINKYKEQR